MTKQHLPQWNTTEYEWISLVLDVFGQNFSSLMDDVLIVVGLLLFGSSLFCLCCYKVSNLLYMLYHIDDAESAAGDISTAAVTSATAALAVAAPTSASPPKLNSCPEDKLKQVKHVVKNNGAVTSGMGAESIYSHLNNYIKQTPPQVQASPDVDGKATSMLTLIPSSSTTSLANDLRQLHKAGN